MKQFPICDILSVTTEQLCGPMDGIYKILNYMTDDNLYTHQLPRAARMCQPCILQQHPKLASVNTEGLSHETFHEWQDEQRKLFGETLLIEPLKDWEKKNPFIEAIEMENQQQ